MLFVLIHRLVGSHLYSLQSNGNLIRVCSDLPARTPGLSTILTVVAWSPSSPSSTEKYTPVPNTAQVLDFKLEFGLGKR